MKPCSVVLWRFCCWEARRSRGRQRRCPLGKWLTEEGKGHVEIAKEGGKFTGKIVWFEGPNYPEGDPEPGNRVMT
jgi:uncharacterized protein (DUF2147 family)